MSGILYIVSTPIGNLQDLTPRAAATFGLVDFIAAEDTRVTLKLLNHLGLKKPLISYYEHNAIFRGEEILARVSAGQNCALCSDAGTPAISDPGEKLVIDAMERGISVVPIPAASAAVTALSVSGQSTTRFVFEGFLPQNQRRRDEHLVGLKEEKRTIVLYEAPHKLRRTLRDLAATMGEERSVTLCRELTKMYEEIVKTTLGEALCALDKKPPRGEYVLVLAGAPEQPSEKEAGDPNEAASYALQLMRTEDITASRAAKEAAKEFSLPKSEVYRILQQQRTDADDNKKDK